MSSSLTHHRASLQGAGGPGWPQPRSGEALVWGRSHEYLSERGFYPQVEDSRGVSRVPSRSAGDPEAGALGGRSGRWADGSAGAWATGWPFPGGAGLLFQPPLPVLQKVPTWASGPNLPAGALGAPASESAEGVGVPIQDTAPSPVLWLCGPVHSQEDGGPPAQEEAQRSHLLSDWDLAGGAAAHRD